MALTNYTLGDIQQTVKRQFGDESGVQITNSDIERWTNQACMEINSKNKVLRKEASIDMFDVNGSYSIDFPDDTMTIIGVDYHSRTNTNSVNQLEGIGYEEWRRQFPVPTKSGTPIYWTMFAEKILIGALPDKTYVDALNTDSVTVLYIPEPERVSDAGDFIPLPDRYFDRIVEFVMSKAYELDENWQGHQTSRQMFEDSLDLLNNAETEMEGPYIGITNVDVW